MIETEVKTETNGDYYKAVISTPPKKKITITTVQKKAEITQVNKYLMVGKKEIELQSMESNSDKEKLVIPKTVTAKRVKYKVTSIKKNAFKGHKRLASLVIGDSVRTIGAGAFSKDTALESVKNGKSVKSIGAGAFSGDKKLKLITIRSATLTSVGKKAFSGIVMDERYGSMDPKNITLR